MKSLAKKPDIEFLKKQSKALRILHRQRDFELKLLAFPGAKGAPVSFPVPTKSVKLSFFTDSAEGERSAVLFSYADGSAPGNAISIEESTLLGKVVAGIHSSTDTL